MYAVRSSLATNTLTRCVALLAIFSTTHSPLLDCHLVDSPRPCVDVSRDYGKMPSLGQCRGAPCRRSPSRCCGGDGGVQTDTSGRQRCRDRGRCTRRRPTRREEHSRRHVPPARGYTRACVRAPPGHALAPGRSPARRVPRSARISATYAHGFYAERCNVEARPAAAAATSTRSAPWEPF